MRQGLHAGLKVQGRRLILLLLVAGVAVIGTASEALAKSQSIKTEAFFLSYDPDASTIEVKVKKTGSRPKNKKLKLKTGREATFKVKPEGSVLTRTTVALDGQREDITKIREGQFLFIYWVPDVVNQDQRFARKIDLVLTDEELDARNDARMKAAQEAGQVQGDE